MASLALTLAFVAIVVFSALVGFVRGFSKTIIRLITFALAVVATFLVSGAVTNMIAEMAIIEGKTIGQFILESLSQEEMMTRILASAPLLEEAILTAPSFVIGFAAFPVCFIVLSFISWILFLILSRPLRKLFFGEGKKAKVGMKKRFAGFAVGAVTGVLVFSMLMAPVYGLISVLPEKSALEKLVDTLEDQGALDAATAELIKGELTFVESPIYTVPTALGLTATGKSYLDSVSKVERDGEETYLTAEFDTLFVVLGTAIEGELIEAFTKMAEDQSALYAVLGNEAFMKELIGDMFNSKLLRSAIPEVTAIALEATARMLGVPENKEEVYENMMGDIAELVKSSDVDFEGIAAYEEAHNISYIDSDEQRTIMTEEEYNAEMKKLEKLEKEISKVVNNNVAGGSEAVATGIAKGFVKTVKAQVKEEGAAYLQNFDPAKVQEKMAAIDPADIVVEGEDTAAIADMLGKVQSPENFETTVATVENIADSIRNTVKDAVKDDSNTTETANTLASVVSNFAGAVAGATDASGAIDPMKLDFEKLGNAVGALQNSTLNGVGSAVLDIVVSGDLGKDPMIGAALGGIKDAYNEGKELSDTIKTAGDIIGVVDAMNKAEGDNTEDFKNSFEKLVKNLKESTLELLPSIITDEMLISFGIPEEQTKPSFEILDTLLHELVKLQGSENYDNEVNAILALYEFGTGDLTKVTEDDIPGIVDYAFQSDAIYNTLMKIAEGEENPFGIKIEAESDFEYFADMMDRNYETSLEKHADEADKVYDIYVAVAKFLDVADRVSFIKK